MVVVLVVVAATAVADAAAVRFAAMGTSWARLLLLLLLEEKAVSVRELWRDSLFDLLLVSVESHPSPDLCALHKFKEAVAEAA